jgi:hypothetical protein
MIQRTWIINDRFQRARFVLVGGPTILVPAEDLQRALDTTLPVRLLCSLRIDPWNSTINGQPVHLQFEA